MTLRTCTSVERLSYQEGRVSGVHTRDARARRREIRARRGVVLATGGLSHGGTLRTPYVPASAGTLTAAVDPGTAPRGARLASDIGARLSEPTDNGGFWVPVSTFSRRDGSRGVFPHTVTDRAKPGLIAVGRDGHRFVNESVSYHEFVRAQLASGGNAIPAWLLCDRRFLWKYGLGKVKPFAGRSKRRWRAATYRAAPRSWRSPGRSGYLRPRWPTQWRPITGMPGEARIRSLAGAATSTSDIWAMPSSSPIHAWRRWSSCPFMLSPCGLPILACRPVS